MFSWIIGSSLKFRFLVLAVAAALLVFGAQQLRKMPVDVFPEFAPPQVEIQTEGPGMTSAEVEELITIPMEDALRGTPGVEFVRSSSVQGLSQVRLLFKMGSDLMAARQRVQERVKLAIAELPQSSGMPVMLQPLSSTSRVMKIGLTSDELSLIDMSLVAYWKIRARLLRVPGVANVPIWGERLHQYQVLADPERLRAHDVSLISLQEQTAKNLDVGSLVSWSDAGEVGTGGFIDGPNQRLNVRHVFPVITPEDFSQVTIQNRFGETLLLSDVADLVIDHQPLLGDAVINDGPGLMLIVEKLPWANTLDVTRGVEDAIEMMRPGLQGIEIGRASCRERVFITV